MKNYISHISESEYLTKTRGFKYLYVLHFKGSNVEHFVNEIGENEEGKDILDLIKTNNIKFTRKCITQSF